MGLAAKPADDFSLDLSRRPAGGADRAGEGHRNHSVRVYHLTGLGKALRGGNRPRQQGRPKQHGGGSFPKRNLEHVARPDVRPHILGFAEQLRETLQSVGGDELPRDVVGQRNHANRGGTQWLVGGGEDGAAARAAGAEGGAAGKDGGRY